MVCRGKPRRSDLPWEKQETVQTSDHASSLIRVRRLFLSWVILLEWIHALYAGDIRGRVVAEPSPANDAAIISRTIIQRYAARKSGYGHETSHEHSEMTAVVYLLGVPDTLASSERSIAVMDQQNEQFIPHVLPITVGTTVRFLNSEEIYHNVFSLSRTKTFDLGRYPKGKYREVLFDKPGVVSVYCDIHTHMNAFILVLPTSYFTTTDAEGNFRLNGIPAGTYELRAWHGRWSEKSQKVVVRENGVTEVNFVFP